MDESPGSLLNRPTTVALVRTDPAPGTGAAQSPATPEVKPVYSAPIKADLIGKPDDAQLKAALDRLVQIAGKQTDPH